MLKKYSSLFNKQNLFKPIFFNKYVRKVEYDIVVGVSTKDCEKTISKIVKTVDRALTKYFSKYNSLILCCDGFSKDGTKKCFSDIKTKTDKKIITEKGKRSKGSAIKTIIQKVKPFNFQVLLVLDGDLENIKEIWIKRLISQVLEKGNDVSIASYTVDKNDFLIGNNLVRPLTKALFNTNLRNPMIGEYCLSRKVCLNLIGSKYFPTDSSIDLFINLSSVCEKYKVVEIKLGPRNHCSSLFYRNPETIVIPKFNQIVKELIQLMRYYKLDVKRDVKHNVEKKGSFEKGKPRKIEIDIKSYKEFSRNYIFNELEYVQEIYNNLNKQSVMGLKIAWLNWLCIYFEKTEKMSNENAVKLRKELTKLFIENKHLLKL